MKQIYCLLLFSFFISTGIAQLNITWTDPVDVASSFGNDYPRIVLDNDNSPLITWGGGNKIYFSKKTATGFAEAIKLNNDMTNAYVATWTGPDIAARNDTIYACFMHQDWEGKTYLIRSFDNGESFSEPVLIENYPDSTSRFPMVAIDQTGNPIVGIMKMSNNGHNPHYVVRKSFDHGGSFTGESNAGGWSGAESEACDCCPGSIKASGEKVAVYYRDNLNNIRDIYASVSTDNGTSFLQGFPVDDNLWELFSCPASGPDGVIIGDTLYTVFSSKNYCYLSKASIDDGSLFSVSPLGASPDAGTQNFPRIDHYNNEVAISWRVNTQGTKIFVAYTEDITNGLPLAQDTVYTSSVSSADIALGENGIHLVVEDISSGNVKYLRGFFGTSSNNDLENESVKIYPNPAADLINIEGYESFEVYKIYSIDGKVLDSGKVSSSIDISALDKGSLVLELINADLESLKKIIVKN